MNRDHPTQKRNQTGPILRKRRRIRFKFKPLPLFLLVAIISVSYQLFLGLFGLVVNHYRLTEQNKILDEKKKAIVSLKEEKRSWESESLIEEEARKLGMIKDGEFEELIPRLEPEESLEPEGE